jgi:hypothetical protein
MDLEETLIEAERAGWNALTTAEGAAYYRERAQFEMRDPRVVTLTDASGVVVYSVVARRAGEEPYSAIVSSTFVRRGAAWKLAFHQQTPA